MLGRSPQPNAFAGAQAPRMPARRMKMRYGFNEIYGWWHLSQGEHRDEIQRRLRLMDTKVVRVFVFDQPVPNPFKEWHAFEGMLQAILDLGAKPMITFAKFTPPYDRKRNIAEYVARSAEIVWSCIERWGGEEVSQWYWCIWNEPNNLAVGGDLTIDQYIEIYDAISSEILKQLSPFLGSRKALIGGPAADGTHRAFWMDWIARLLAEIDERQIGFVSWHRYGDWRPAVPSNSLPGVVMWGSPDSPNGAAFEPLLLAQTPVYEAAARGVERLLQDRDVLNVCGELNTMSHHEYYYTLGYNQNLLGAAYYASVLIHLIRGGADLEMRWTATAHTDAYGLIYMDGKPSPAALAKQLFAQHVRHGDEIRFPADFEGAPKLDTIIAREGKRLSAVFVNPTRECVTITPADWDGELDTCGELFRLDESTDEKVAPEKFAGRITLNGYGIAVITNADTATVID